MLLTDPPPQSAPQPDDGVIAEARARQRRRRGVVALVVLLAIALGGAAYAALVRGGAAGSAAAVSLVDSSRCPGRSLGILAFTRLGAGALDVANPQPGSGALDVVDLRDCVTRTLVRAGVGAGAAPAFSPDGRHIAFAGGWVATGGGRVHRTRGGVQPSFSPDGRDVAYANVVVPVAGGAPIRLAATFLAWVPGGGDLLMARGARGAIELRSPAGAVRALTPPGWTFAAVSPDGRFAVLERYRSLSSRHPPLGGQLWLLDLRSGSRRLLYSQPRSLLSPFARVSFSANGRWVVFSEDPQGSSSLAADGVPWRAVGIEHGMGVHAIALTVGPSAWCGGGIVYAIDHGGRQVTMGDGVAVAMPPSWRSSAILPARGATSFGQPACRPGAGAPTVALAGGPSSADAPFGHEDRSLWLAPVRAGATARRIAASVPPRGSTDELPMWSADGRWLLFVQTAGTAPSSVSGAGTLEAIDMATGRLVGPIARVGRTTNYYGTYGWPGQIAYHP